MISWEVTFGASLGSAAVEGSGVSAELCVAVLNACGPIPALSCSALHPAPAGCPVYSLLCAKWMSLPSLKCWCVASSPSFGLARSEQQRCRVQLCATLRDLLLPGLLGSAEPAEVPEPTHRGFWRRLRGGEAQVKLCWEEAEDGLLLVGASGASNQGLRTSHGEGVSTACRMGCQCQPTLASLWTWGCGCCSRASPDVPGSAGTPGCTGSQPRGHRNPGHPVLSARCGLTWALCLCGWPGSHLKSFKLTSKSLIRLVSN